VNEIGVFPFGQPIRRVVQQDRTKKCVFVLGVYASAVHARWVDKHGQRRISAVAVASEPEIFWAGDSVDRLVRAVAIPEGAGHLEPAGPQLNGPSGRALDHMFLEPLGLSRDDAWLCDLVPHSCMNAKQQKAIEQRYIPEMERLGLPEPRWPTVPKCLASCERRAEIQGELDGATPAVLVTLGDQPLRWFAKFHGAHARLQSYGTTPGAYGRLHPIQVGGRDMQLLPVVHPRQAARLGTHSSGWASLHEHWAQHVASDLLSWRHDG